MFAFLWYLLHFNGVSFVFNMAVKIVLVLKVRDPMTAPCVQYIDRLNDIANKNRLPR